MVKLFINYRLINTLFKFNIYSLQLNGLTKFLCIVYTLKIIENVWHEQNSV